jgi:hypothetical protein
MNNKIWLVIIAFVIGIAGGWTIGNYRKPSTNNNIQTNSVSQKDVGLKLGMRKLWEDHITWTRMYLVSAINSLGDKDPTLARLLQNQVDIGNAIKPYYGNEAGDKLTSLLKEHITLAGEVVTAAVNQDQAALGQADSKWHDNGNAIADFLARANPNLPKDQLREMMKEHLDLTKQEAVDILQKNSDASIADYDKVHDQILQMADMISSGIIKQYSDKF